MLTGEKLYTIDEFWDAFGDTKHVELVKGEPVTMAPTGAAHGAVSLTLGHLIFAYVDEHDLGMATAAETGFVLSANPATVRAPDVGFVAKARLPDPIPEQFFPGPPNLAVDVASPNNSASDLHAKVMEYLHAGTRLVWVVYPSSRTVMVYRPDSTAQIIDASGTLDGGDVLPGLSLPVRDVFKKLRE